MTFKFFIYCLCAFIANIHFVLAASPHLFQNDSLISDSVCHDQITSLCGSEPDLQNNLAVLSCISQIDLVEEKLSSDCQHKIWSFKYEFTKLEYLSEIAKVKCKSLLITNKDCLEPEDVENSGANIVSCLMERIQPDTTYGCKNFLHRMEMITFGDYRMVNKFANVCETHIKMFKCGRLNDMNKNEILHSQVNTINCLQKHITNLSQACTHEILRISELQSNDFHLDRPLYFACRSDREKFCKSVESGNGLVYKCLMQNMRQSDMSEECKERLLEREHLIIQDYKVSKSLGQSCKADIKKYSCRDNTSDRKEVRLAQILLCLENVQAKNLPIASNCLGEMLLHRQRLLEDYKLTPNLVEACKDDIENFCHNVEFGSKMLHCLMKFIKTKRHRGDAHVRNRISSHCKSEMEILLKEVNVAEDWRVDPVLQEACQSTVDSVCKNTSPGGGRILNCLAEHIDSSLMTEECREALNQMQYFVVRDFELDIQIYNACHSDAVKYCHAKRDWYNDLDDMDPERGPTVMACLYRYVYHPDEAVRLKKNCVFHVKRVMKQRAASVDLLPFIEEPCMQDLSKYCSSEESVLKKGYEMECLQDNYNHLQLACQNAIGNFTQNQNSHFELNYSLFKSCSTVAKELCSEEYEDAMEDDQGKLIQCLIRHKSSFQLKADIKCRNAIDHFQLTNIKDFRFDVKFKDACKSDISMYCSNLRTKYDVINCLSTLLYNDTMSNTKKISKNCKKILRMEILQQSENIAFDPSLEGACQFDRKQFCSDVENGDSLVIECLKKNIIKLKKSCQRHLFRKQLIELSDNSLDYSLLTICKNAINRYCLSFQMKEVLYCLRDHRNEPKVNPNCRSLILKRLMHQNLDYRLNPRIKIGCKKEINKYCSEMIIHSKPDELLDGKVVSCLKKQYLHNTLSQTCEIEIINIIREVSMNIELDPVLFKACIKEINTKCSKEIDIHECLKTKFLSKNIEDNSCKNEVARLIKETEADIESDPHLFNVCVQDIKSLCGDVVAGKGQQLNCLTTIHRNTPRQLSPECDTLLQKRLQLFEYAAEVNSVDSVVQVLQIVAKSPIHNFFYFTFLFVIFFIFTSGILFGRFANRIAVTDKIK